MSTLTKVFPLILAGLIVVACGSKEKTKEPASETPSAAPHVAISTSQISGDLVTVKFGSTSKGVTFKCKIDKAGQSGIWESCGPDSYMFLQDGKQANIFSVKAVGAGMSESVVASRHFAANLADPIETPTPAELPEAVPTEPGHATDEPGAAAVGIEADFAGAIFLSRNGMCEIRYGNDTELVECNSYYNQQQCSMAINLSFPKLKLKNPPLCFFQGTGCYSLNQGVRPQIANMSNVQVDVVFGGLPQPRHLCDDIGQIAIFLCKISD